MKHQPIYSRFAISLFAVLASNISCARIDRPGPTVLPVGSERTDSTASSGGVVAVPQEGAHTLPVTVSPTRDTTRIAPAVQPTSADLDRVADNEPLPPMPEEPVIEPSMRARVITMQAVIAQTNNCIESPMMSRIPHVADQRCPGWYQQLAQGGVAAAHAIGQRIIPGTQVLASQNRFAALLTQTGETVAAQYFARRFHRVASMSEAESTSTLQSETEVLTQFELLTGYPVNDVPNWQSVPSTQLATKYRPTLIRALRWWHRVGTQSREGWAAEGEARMRAWLAAEPAKAVHAALLIAARTGNQPLRMVAIDAMLLLVDNGRTPANERRAAQYALNGLRIPASVRTRMLD